MRSALEWIAESSVHVIALHFGGLLVLALQSSLPALADVDDAPKPRVALVEGLIALGSFMMAGGLVALFYSIGKLVVNRRERRRVCDSDTPQSTLHSPRNLTDLD